MPLSIRLCQQKKIFKQALSYHPFAMHHTGLLGLLAGIAVAVAISLAVLLFVQRRQTTQALLVLSGLLVAISLRLAKSIWYFIVYDVAAIGVSIGYLGLASIGPLLWWYIRSSRQNQSYTFLSILPHGILPLTGTFAILYAPHWAGSWYEATTGILGIYLLLAWIIHLRHNYDSPPLSAWNLRVLLMATGVWAAFVFQHITDTMQSYAYGAGLAAIPIYYLLFYTIQNRLPFKTKVISTLPKDVLQKVDQAFRLKKIYRTSGLQLVTLAEQIELPSYQLSAAVRHLYQRSFPEAVNYFRIQEAKVYLQTPQEEYKKIATLANEVGFRSTSAFYEAFKKETGLTPTAYKAEQIDVS